MNVGTILALIDNGTIALPEFQRGYVWNRDQVRGLMTSLYRRHPVGGLLVWSTEVNPALARGNGAAPSGGTVDMLLDGQQRVTTLYGVIRGYPPRFFDGNPATLSGLMFNVSDETFEFYAPVKMKDNPLWIDVTKAMQPANMASLMADLGERLSGTDTNVIEAMQRIINLQNIQHIDFHIEKISGADKTVDVVVDIFNRVNSGGTTLSKGDLALAKICAEWPDARDEMKRRLRKWERHGYSFRLEWLLRSVTAVTTGEAFFSSLAQVDSLAFAQGLDRTEQLVDTLLNQIAGRLGLDHTDVLGSVASFPLMARLLHQYGKESPSARDWDQILFWYTQTSLWGRYAGSTESVLSQDLRQIQTLDGAFDRLSEQLRQSRGDLHVRPADFLAWGRGARFYSLLYMLSRVHGARDLGLGLELRANLLGNLMRLQLHHIFPKAKLYRRGSFTRPEVNSLANFMFLTQSTNLQISDQDPERYFTEYENRNPGVLESQWIPMDPALWRYENYRDFLAARRQLLADAANTFLDKLVAGSVPATNPAAAVVHDIGDDPSATMVMSEADDELSRLDEVRRWLESHSLPTGQLYWELVEEANTAPTAVLDLAWPEGLQTGLSQPVALLLDETPAIEKAANDAGFRYFRDVKSFQDYVMADILGELAAD